MRYYPAYPVAFTLLLILALPCSRAAAQGTPLAPYLRDRGPGVATSMFGTYIQRGELLVYPFFEYYLDNNAEYSPAELGYGLDQDFRGRYRASEGLIFLGYGVSDWLAIELEAAVISASLETAAEDPTATPAQIEESGLGDVEGQLRARVMRETEARPELFSYFEWVAPTQKDKVLIGTRDWEFKGGLGLTRGFRWGTTSIRLAGEYSLEESAFELGEYAVEYLKRVSPAWRLYFGVEGSQDEVELITQVEWEFARGARLRLNNAFGLTSKATDWAPEVGVMFSLGVPRD
jgi:hypothetical protein